MGIRIVETVCPYCGRPNKIEVTRLYNDYQVVVCDVMEGGCDRPFVADIQVTITAAGRKIEGEG